MRSHVFNSLIGVSVLLLMFNSSLSSGAITQADVGVSTGDTFGLKVTDMTGLLSQFKNEVITMGNHTLLANETVNFKVTDATLNNVSIAVQVSTQNGTFDGMIPLDVFGSPIVNTNWGAWANQLDSLKTLVAGAMTLLNDSNPLNVNIPNFTYETTLTTGDKLVSVALTGKADDGSQLTLNISYKKDTGVMNEVVMGLLIKNNVLDVTGGVTVQNTNYVTDTTSKAAPGFGLALTFASLLIMIPILRRRFK